MVDSVAAFTSTTRSTSIEAALSAILAELRRLADARFTGPVTIHFGAGVPRKIEGTAHGGERTGWRLGGIEEEG